MSGEMGPMTSSGRMSILADVALDVRALISVNPERRNSRLSIPWIISPEPKAVFCRGTALLPFLWLDQRRTGILACPLCMCRENRQARTPVLLAEELRYNMRTGEKHRHD